MSQQQELKSVVRLTKAMANPVDIDAPLNNEMERKVVGKAILELDEEHRVIARMCILEGMTDQEVATRARLNTGTVTSIRNEAVAQLRDKLKGTLLS